MSIMIQFICDRCDKIAQNKARDGTNYPIDWLKLEYVSSHSLRTGTHTSQSGSKYICPDCKEKFFNFIGGKEYLLVSPAPPYSPVFVNPKSDEDIPF